MRMATLWHTFTRICSARDLIALDHCHMVEMISQHTRHS